MKILLGWCSMKVKFSSQQRKDNLNVSRQKFLKTLSYNLDFLNKLFELKPKPLINQNLLYNYNYE